MRIIFGCLLALEKLGNLEKVGKVMEVSGRNPKPEGLVNHQQLTVRLG